MKKYEIRVGFKMTCADTKYETVIFDAMSPDDAIEKAKKYGEILRKDFRDEYCTVFISEVHEKR